ncbi:MAG: thiamine phosphate synthase [Candidatus Xiphinematobacter sp.]|nr:MAG: thiamine phosphate synthase [Candidatus Xiphinematobacter sp.]
MPPLLVDIPFILNDYPQLVTRTGVSGFHIGQEDLSLDKARALAGRDVIGGCSTHNITQAQSASSAGADYISFGPLFHASTKPGYPPTGLAHIKEVEVHEVEVLEVHDLVVHDLVSAPIFCIGGIKRENLPTILDAGARRVAIVPGILQAKLISGSFAETARHY